VKAGDAGQIEEESQKIRSKAMSTDTITRQIEESVSLNGAGRVRIMWYRLRAVLSDMNYAARRIVEVQAFPGR
jgi:hypothetical protein